MPILSEHNPQFQRRRNKRGMWVILFFIGSALCFTLYMRFLAPPAIRQQAEASTTMNLSAPQKPIQPPAAEKPEPMPPPKPQAESKPRVTPAAKPEKKEQSAWQKELEKRRLAAAWALPVIDWKGNEKPRTSGGGRQNGNPNTLEIPSANQRAGSGTGAGTPREGAGNVWRSRFDQRGFGQPGVYQQATNPYVVMPGTVIPVRLLDGINTDTPSQITAVVEQDVYDTATGKYLLIPRGTKAIGGYDHQIAYSQERLPNAWNLLVFPNSDWMSIASFPGADREGVGGIPIETSNHFLGTFVRSALLTLTGATAQIAVHNAYGSNGLDPEEALGIEASRQMRSTGQTALSRGMYRPPTGTAKGGDVFFLQVTAPLQFRGPYEERTDVADAE